MTSYTFGEVSWDAASGSGKKTNMKDLFLRLMPGENEVRVVTSPFQYTVHKYKAEGEKGFGRKVLCSATRENPECPLCAMGDKAKRKYYIGVIDLKTSSYKILDMSYAVFQQMGALVSNKRWGDIRGYDINILVKPEAGAVGYYTVQPLGKEPLSPELQLIRDKDVDLDMLKKLSTPPTPEMVKEKLAKIHESLGAGGLTTTSVAKVDVKGKKQPVPVADDSEEFEDYN